MRKLRGYKLKMLNFKKLKHKPYIIAEIGINHNGYLNLAKKMIIEAKKAGANAVKFQKRDVDDLVNFNTNPGKSNGYLSKNEKDIKKKKLKFGTWVYPDTRLELNLKDYKQIKKIVKQNKLDLIITPWDEKSVEFVLGLGVDSLKIASIDANNYQFCEYIAKKKYPTIISTGMCTYKEILITQKIFKKYKAPHIFLHCTSAYPSDEKDKNLNCIPKLKKLLGEDVGFSGHGTGVVGAIGATTLGAKIIEKHVTLNKKMLGPDHAASLEFSTFKEMTDLCKKAHISLGSSEKKFLDSEKVLHNVLSRKMVVRKTINKGKIIQSSFIKPALTYQKKGLHPKNFYKIIGKKTKKILIKGHIILKNDLK